MSRILVVEDSRTQALALQYVLEAEGFEVVVASNAEQAIGLFNTSDFDLVITDILMPGQSGYDMCRELKHHPAKRHIPVILLTTLSDPLDILRGIECGADNYLTKPYLPEVLISRIRYTLANKARRADGRVKVGVELSFLGQTFVITSDKEQILDLLIATCEDVVRTNQQLRVSQAELEKAKQQVEQYARLMEEQARSSRDKYHRLMEQAHDAIFILDLQGRVLEANRHAEALLGRTADQIVGLAYDSFVLPEERDSVLSEHRGRSEKDHLQRILTDGHAQRDRLRVNRTDGKQLYVDYSATLVDVGDERIILVIAHDVTEHHCLEQQLSQVQKMEAIGRLAGGVAHDFNNLLTVINGYGQLLLDRLPVDDPSRALVAEMTAAGEKAASLTQQLLAFSRQQIIEPQVLYLDKVVRDAEMLLRRLIGEDVELTILTTGQVGPVLADPGQLTQVLMNLAVNARDAMPQGGKLTIETHIVELDRSYAQAHAGVQPGRYAMLAVSDTGQGMSEEVKARIFEPFFTTKDTGKGTGLGLATVYGIVKRSKGHVYLYSELGRGTTFKVYLPIAQTTGYSTGPKSRSGLSRFPGGGETILVVEDEDSVRALTRHVLERSGYVVLEARDGEEALRLCQQHSGTIHLVISDVVMPRLGGRDLADRLAELRPGLKLLFLSGYTEDAVVRHGILEQEVAFLQKPFSPTVLARKVREVLDGE